MSASQNLLSLLIEKKSQLKADFYRLSEESVRKDVQLRDPDASGRRYFIFPIKEVGQASGQ
jgi:hypothetical protein